MNFEIYLLIYQIFGVFVNIRGDESQNIVFKKLSLNLNSSTQTTTEYFEDFKEIYGKQYKSEENEMRKNNFKKSIEFIEKHNQMFIDGNVSHQLAINKFIDLTDEELSKLNLKSIEQKLQFNTNQSYYSSKPVSQIEVNSDSEIPLNFDWRQLNKVTPVKDQLICNCCYAFVVTASIESAIAIQNNLTIDLSDSNDKQIDLSEQQIIDCSIGGKYHNNGCKYGFIDDSLQYVVDRGLVSEDMYPYIDETSSCLDQLDTNRTFISTFVRKGGQSEDQIKDIIRNKGPVIALIDNEGLDFLLYDNGIISTEYTERVGNYFNHAVVIVGWGHQNGTNYWIIKNSWSEEWGENGFARIASGVRGVDKYIYYPVLATSAGNYDIYSNVLFYVLAIIMFIAVIAIWIYCCDTRGKFVYRSGRRESPTAVRKLFNKKEYQLSDPDVVVSSRESNVNKTSKY